MTPGTPRFIARRLENKEDKVNAEDHETYRSGVGTLVYLTKHSRPDISNPVRELSKTMDAPAPAHLKEMYKLIRSILSTKDYGLKFKLIKSMRKWVLKALSDSDFASDKETRISIFGYVIYFCGIPIAWRSKGMKSVVLSTTEAEYMALSEVVKELKFIVQLLQTMNITVEFPITVHVDNVGAIWLSNNRNTGDRTKHIDIRTAFVKEYQEDGKIIIKFVKSEDNEADIQTPPTYKCPHGRPCYFLSTNWPTVIYGSKYFFPNIFIFLFFLYSSSSSMNASNARKASITSLNHGCSCGSSWNNV